MNFLQKLDVCVSMLETLEMMHELTDGPKLDNLYTRLRAAYNNLVADLDPAEYGTELRGVELYGLQNYIFVAAHRQDCTPACDEGFTRFGDYVKYGEGDMYNIVVDAISEANLESYPPSVKELAIKLTDAILFNTKNLGCPVCGDELYEFYNYEECERCGYDREMTVIF